MTKDEAMRIALEALGTVREWEVADYDPLENAITALRQAIEQAEKQEPVAQCTNSDSWNCKYCRKTETCEALRDSRNFGTPVLPPRKEWVGLTDEEREYLWSITPIEDEDRFAFVLAVEAKLKEKNT